MVEQAGESTVSEHRDELRLGFLSFGHWQRAQWSRTLTAKDALTQTIELAQAAEELGIDGAFVRVHHFARQLGSPFPSATKRPSA
jgi:alkanesulfonate monooxygenase SsuD/methylene tetrahydromethanopterin reductase-like flavin-dependent oxidoreductase (luciferase family)